MQTVRGRTIWDHLLEEEKSGLPELILRYTYLSDGELPIGDSDAGIQVWQPDEDCWRPPKKARFVVPMKDYNRAEIPWLIRSVLESLGSSDPKGTLLVYCRGYPSGHGSGTAEYDIGFIFIEDIESWGNDSWQRSPVGLPKEGHILLDS